MLLALSILLWLLLGLVAVFVLLIALPLHLQVRVQSDTGTRAQVTAKPFGGAFIPLRIYDSQRKAKPKRETKKPKAKRKTRGALTRLDPSAITTLPQTAGRILRTVHITDLDIDGEFGTGDPAETGQIYGQLTPILYGSGLNIRLRPNFDLACLRGTLRAHISVIPIAFAWPMVGLLWRMFGPFK